MIGKMRDSGILNTIVATEKWLVGDANPRIVAADLISYKQIFNGSIVPDTVYTFRSNKPIAESSIGVFSPSQLNRNQTYFKPTTHFASYNAKSKPIEIEHFSSRKKDVFITDYDDNYVTATVTNASLSEVAYTSFESNKTGNWTIPSDSRNQSESVTGKKSYDLNNGSLSKSLDLSKSYILTFWGKAGSSFYVNSASVPSPISTHRGWNLYQLVISGVSNVTLSGAGLVDEVRLIPKDANIQTAAFEPLVGKISESDINNSVLYTTYDKLLRPKLTMDMDYNILKKYEYSDTVFLINTASIDTKIGYTVGALSVAWGAKQGIMELESSLLSTKIFRFTKTTSRAIFGVGAIISVGQAGRAWASNKTTKQKWVATAKAAVDIAVSRYALVGGVPGWTVGAIYFIGEISGFNQWVVDKLSE